MTGRGYIDKKYRDMNARLHTQDPEKKITPEEYNEWLKNYDYRQRCDYTQNSLDQPYDQLDSWGNKIGLRMPYETHNYTRDYGGLDDNLRDLRKN